MRSGGPKGVHASGHARAHAPLPARRAHDARPPGPAALLPAPPSRGRIGRGRTGRHSEEGQDDREEDEDLRTRTAKAEDRTAVDAPVPAAKDTAAVGTTAADSMATAVAATVATVAATMSSACGARHRCAREGLSREGQRAAGSRGQTPCRQAGAYRDSPAIRRDSVASVMWSRKEVTDSVSAQLVDDDVDLAMPANGDAGGGQARAVPNGVVRQSRGQRAARVRGRRRHRGRAHTSPESSKCCESVQTNPRRTR